MGFGREARRVRDDRLPHGQRLRALSHCLEWAQPIGFQPSWHYLEAKLGTPRESIDFLGPALDLLERERTLHRDVDQRYSALRRRLKRRGSRAPRADDVTPSSPLRWHGDEREGAAHALRWWLQRHPLEDFVDHPEAKLVVDVARVLALAPSQSSIDLKGLQAALDWARTLIREGPNRTVADRRRAHEVLHLLGQVHIVLNGAPTVGIPWNFTASADEDTRSAAVARVILRYPVGLWRCTPDSAARLIEAATDLLVLGYDAPALRELAGLSPRGTFYEADPVITAALDQIGVADLREGSAERAGLEARPELFLDGDLTLRELSSWAHHRIGHDGEGDLQPFVELDDVYDDWEISGHDLLYLDQVTRMAAHDFLAGRPVTRLDWLEPPARATAQVTRTPELGWRDRVRRRRRPAT